MGETKSLFEEIKQPPIVLGIDNSISNSKPLGLKPKAMFRQVYVVVLANLSVLSSGISLGYPAVTLQVLTDPQNSNALTIAQASWFASINAISSPLGGLLGGYLLDKVGRKKTILVTNLTAIISWLVISTAFHKDNLPFFIQIMISRFIIGITLGMSSSPCGVYAAEVCHPHLRGRLTLGTSIANAAGILLIYIMGYFIRNNWNLINILSGVYAIFAFIITFHIPESPSWLLSKNRPEEAKAIFRFFSGLKKTDTCYYEEIDTEFSRMQKSAVQPNNQKKKKFRKLLTQPEVWKPLLIMTGFFAFQQFSGIFVVIVYAVQFSIEAGVTIDPVLCAMLIGLTRLLTTFLVGYISDKWGRRPPSLISGLGMSICMMLLAGSTWFPFLAEIPYLSIGCIIMYIFTSSFGLMTLPFSMISEVFPQRIRGQCAGLSICFCSLMSFVIIKEYPTMVEEMGKENVFAFYGIVSLLAVIFVYIYLPETKGKNLHEIEEYFIYGTKGKPKESAEVEMKHIFVKQ